MDVFRQDIRIALRLVARRPGFTVVSLATLALGIGASTAMFSVVNAVIFDALPFESPDRIVRLMGTAERDAGDPGLVSFPEFQTWWEEAEAFDAVAVIDHAEVNLTGATGAERIEAAFTLPTYFTVLGTGPLLGRRFTPGESAREEPLAVISHGLWTRRFAADTTLLGRSIWLNGVPTTVIGVMGPEFNGITGTVDVWLPLMSEVVIRTDRPVHLFERRDQRFLVALARLAPEIRLAEANSELAVIAARLQEEYPVAHRNRWVTAIPLEEEILGPAKDAAVLVLVAVAVVLLIACVNVANLRFARDIARRKELALRQAVGASRGRIVRYLLTESVTLAMLGGALGLLVAMWTMELLSAMNPISLPSYVTLGMDMRALGFTFLLALLTGFTFGLVPALRMTDTRVAETLRNISRATSEANPLWDIRNVMVVGQLGLALVVLVGAGLMIRSFLHQMRIDPGVDRENLVSLSVQLPRLRYERGQVQEFTELVRERLGSLHGVRDVAMTSSFPLSGRIQATTVRLEGERAFADEAMHAFRHEVTPNFFATMGIPILAGRSLSSRDTYEAPRVVVVSATMVRRAWPGKDVIGKRIGLAESDSDWYTVVGIVADVRHRRLVDETGGFDGADLYFPLYQVPVLRFDIAVRASVDPLMIAEPVRREFRRIDPDVPVFNMSSFDELIEREVALTRFASMQLGSYGLLALVLAAVGLYGVISHAVASRINEISVRIALGAGPLAVLKLVLRRGFWMIGMGVAVGLFGAFVVTRTMAHRFYGVSAIDLPIYVAVTAVLACVGLLACLVPARRALKVEPIKALKEE
ncbi:MAG: ABC transporter permease [Gemmatimonadetes bacterium]|nr:ABC transporter permease [Gemmatimonadota bacterium]